MRALCCSVLSYPVSLHLPEKSLVFRKSFSINSPHLASPIYPNIVARTTPLLPSEELYTHHSLLCLFSLGFVLISWVEQFLKNANYRLDLAADT